MLYHLYFLIIFISSIYTDKLYTFSFRLFNIQAQLKYKTIIIILGN